MTNTGDYYVRFDSNAAAWALDIENQVGKARTAIEGLLGDLAKTGGAGDVKIKVQDALAKGAGGRAGSDPHGVAGEDLRKSLHTQAEAIDHTTEALADTIRLLKTAGEEIRGLPGSLRTTMGQIKSQIALAVREGTGAAVRDTSGIVRKGGTPEGDAAAVGQIVQKAMRGGAPGIGAAATRGVGFGGSTGIRSIGTASLDKANFDRVITAIRAQTRVLAQALPRRIEGGAINMISGGTPPGGSTKPKEPTITTAPAAAAAEVMKPVLSKRDKLLAEITGIAQSGRAVELDEAKTLVKRLDRELKKLDDDVAGLDDEAQATRDDFKQARSNLRKILAPAERAESGLTKGQQSEANRTAADQARKSRESITDLELADRLRKRQLVASPADPQFQERAKGKYTGEQSPYYSKPELEEMARAFESVGIAVKRTTKTTKEELGSLLQGAHREYQSRFPEGAEALRTSGFNIQRTTKVGEDLVSIVGDLGERAKEILHAEQVLKADYESGGKRQKVSERIADRGVVAGGGVALPGAIAVPPGMIKGRREVGAAIGEHGDSLHTTEDVYEAEKTLRADADRLLARVREQAKSATFDPHPLELNKQIEPGHGPEEQALAQAAQNELRDTRLATERLDAMGKEFLSLSEALATNADLIRRRKEVIKSLQPADYRGEEGQAPQDRARREELQAAEADQARITARLRELSQHGQDKLFQSPEYQQGLVRREGSVSGLGGSSEAQRAHGFYLGEERSGADLEAKRAELKDQIRSNEEQAESARRQIEAVDAETRAAKAGSAEAEQLVDKYLRLVDVMDQCEQNSSALARELGVLDSILETTEEGVKKVAKAVPGMGSRQAADASRTANARLPLFASDYRLLRSATGGAVAPVGTKAGAQQLAGTGLVPGLRFNERQGTYYSAEQKLGKVEQEKLNAATGKLSKAQKDYFLLLSSGEASVEQLNASWARLEQAANRFANRIATSFGGLSPTLGQLTGRGHDAEGSALAHEDYGTDGPALSKKTARDEARRQRARDRAEVERTKKIGADATPEQRLVEAERNFANAERRLKDAREEEAKLVEEAAKQEEALGAGLDPRAKSQAISKALDAEQKRNEAAVKLHQLQQLQLTQDPIHDLSRKGAAGMAPSPATLPPTKEDAAVTRDRANIARQAFEDARAEYDFAIHEYATRPKAKTAAARNRQAFFAEQNLTTQADSVRRLQQIAQASAAKAARTSNLLDPERFAQEARRTQGGAGGAHLPTPEEYVGGYTPFVPGRKGPAGPEVPLQTVNQAVEEAQAAVRQAEDDLKAIAKPLGGLKKVRALAETLTELEQLSGQIAGTGRIARNVDDKGRVSGPRTAEEGLESARDKAEKARDKAQKKVGAEAAPAAKATEELATAERTLTQAEEGRVAALQKERAEIRKAGPYTKTARDAFREQAGAAQRSASAQKGLATRYATSDPARSAAAAAAAKTAQTEATALRAQADATEVARQRIIKINQDLKALGVGRGSGGRGGVPPTGGGSGGGFNEESNNILRQILTAVKAINTTLKGGVKITGRAATTAGGTTAAAGQTGTPKTKTPVTAIGAATSPEEQAKRDKAFEVQQEREDKRARARASNQRAQAAEAEAVGRAEERATKRQTDAIRLGVRADAELAAATAEVSTATKQEIDELTRLTRAAEQAKTAEQHLAAQQAIVAQQTKVAGAMATDLSRKGISATGQRQAIRSTLGVAGPKLGSGEFDSIMRAARPSAQASSGFAGVGQGYGRAMGGGVQSGFQQVFGGGSGFFDRILHTTGTFLVRNFAAGFVFGITNQLQQAIDQAIKTQQTFVRLSSTLAATGKDMGNLQINLQGLSSSYGVPLNDLYDTAAKLAGVFQKSSDLEAGTRVVAQLQMISEGALSADESVGALTSIWAAFQDELSRQGGAEHISDVAVALQNLTGTNVEDTVEGVARLAGLAKQMSISFDETATFVAQIARETNVTGAAAGEQLSRILAQLQGSSGQAAVKDALGTDVFTRNTRDGAIDYGAVLKQIIGDWDNLSKAQQANLTHALAGTRQAATFNALMDNGQKTLQNMAKATDSAGTAQARMSSLMHTLNGEIARLGANFQDLVVNLINTGLLNWLGLFVEAINEGLGALNKLLAGISKFGTENKMAGDLIKLTGTLIGAGAGFVVLRKAIVGLRAAMGARGIGSVLSMGMYGGGMAGGPTGGVVGGRAQEAIQSGEQGALATAMTGQTVAVQAGTAAQAQLTALTANASRTFTALSAAETGVIESSVALAASQEARLAYMGKWYATEKGAQAATEAVTVAQTDLAAALELNAKAQLAGAQLGAAYEAEAAALAAHVEATAALTALERTHAATEEEVAAANALVAETNGLLVTAIRTRIGAEVVAAEAAGASAGIGSRLAGAAGAVATGLIKFLPVLLAFYGVKKEIDGFRAQGKRVDKAATEGQGIQTPESGATGGEYRAAAKNIRDALKQSQGDESRGLFGWGFGPSLTKTVTKGIGGSGLYADKYSAADLHQDNLKSIDESMKVAARAMNYISKQEAAGRVGTKQPTFTSFDSDYLTKRMDELTGKGQTAGMELRELARALAGVGKESKALTSGTYLARGRTTNDLRTVVRANAPGLKQILDRAGARSEDLEGRLQYALGVGHSGAKSELLGGIKQPNGQKRATTTTEAINKMIDQVLKEAVVGSETMGDDYQSRLQAMIGKYGKDSEFVKKYKSTHKALMQFFHDDLNSYATLMQESVLTNAQAITLMDKIDEKAQAALDELPTSALGSRSAVLRTAMQAAQSAVDRSAGGGTPALLERLRRRSDAYAQGEFARLEAVRQVAQSNTKDTKKLYAAGMREVRQGIRVAVQTGSADTLAQVITAGGAVAHALAVEAIKRIHEEWAAYDRLVGKITTFSNAVAAEYKLSIPRPKISRKAAKKLDEAVRLTPYVPTKESSIFSPAFPDKQKAKDDKADANQLRQDRAALVQARLGVRKAYAEAHGDAVRAAQIEVLIAKAQKQAAQADLAAAKNQSERLQAMAAIANAEAQLISAHAGVAQAHAELVSSQYDVAIALATAAGHTVEAAIRQAHQAEAALRLGLRKSGGKHTAEVNQLRASAIQAEAAVRDARLQDELDTIDFNLQMGKITQSGAIHALQHILATEELTKAQRRQLLLQIKGMKDELANSQWNFGDIKLPTPYQMRRYIDQRKKQFRNDMDAAAGHGATGSTQQQMGDQLSAGAGHTTNQITHITIDGADIGLIRKILKEVVGGNVNVRTTAPRRGNR